MIYLMLLTYALLTPCGLLMCQQTFFMKHIPAATQQLESLHVNVYSASIIKDRPRLTTYRMPLILLLLCATMVISLALLLPYLSQHRPMLYQDSVSHSVLGTRHCCSTVSPLTEYTLAFNAFSSRGEASKRYRKTTY